MQNLCNIIKGGDRDSVTTRNEKAVVRESQVDITGTIIR